MMLLTTATHVAGPVVTIGSRTLQRCMVCGEKLADTENMTPVFRGGELVRAKDGAMCGTGKSYVGTKKLPRDFCIALVEE